MNLPFQGPYQSVSILQDKSKFRQFLTENGFQILYKIKGIKSDDSSEQFVSIYFLTTCGQLVSLYYEDGTTTCMIVIGAKTYSGEIVSFE